MCDFVRGSAETDALSYARSVCKCMCSFTYMLTVLITTCTARVSTIITICTCLFTRGSILFETNAITGDE